MNFIRKIRLFNFDFAKKEKNSIKAWLLFIGNLVYEFCFIGITVFMAWIFALSSIPYKNCMNEAISDLGCWEYGKSPLRAIGTLLLFLIYSLLFLSTRSLVTMFMRSLNKRNADRAASDLKNFRAEVAREAKRLAEIRASMTDAEWAAYEIQLENKRLLEEINNKQSRSGGSKTSFMYGVIDD
ncbi:hypothetical protein MCEMRE182_00498 [Candidatus Nanopelagicaceae bacterium]